MEKLNKPNLDGYTFPFEGDKHNGTIILVPYRKDTWEDGGRIPGRQALHVEHHDRDEGHRRGRHEQGAFR